MRIQVNRAARRRGRILRHFSFPRLVAMVIVMGLIGLSLAVGIIIGKRATETDNDVYLEFVTESPLATKLVLPALDIAKATLIDDIDVVGNFARAVLDPGDLDRLKIDIAYLDYQRIAYKRQQALKRGFLISDRSDYVPATLRLGEKTVRAEVRLKGDLPDHWETEKWSFRIKIKGGETLFGMKRFSIQHPATRKYEAEWLADAAMRREGLIGARYRFIDVTVNGKHKGAYALEEHFNKRLIENNERREGPIIKFNEDLFWARLLELDRIGLLPGYATFSASHIDGYNIDPVLQPAFERAIGLLDSFRRGTLSTTQVFDGEQLAMFIALKELLGADEFDWQDMRFYYNPVTSRLEPIAFDLHTGWTFQRLFCFDGGVKLRHLPAIEREDNLAKLIFNDLEFRKLHVRALEKVSSPEYVEAMFADLDIELKRELRILHRDYPTMLWSGDYILKNARYLRDALSPPKAVHAYLQSTKDGAPTLYVGCVQELAVEIIGLATADSTLISPREAVVIPPKRWKTPVNYVPVVFPELPASPVTDNVTGVANELMLEIRIAGSSTVGRVPVFPWPSLPDHLVHGDWLIGASQTPDHPCLHVDDELGTIVLLPGEWRIDRNIILPSGYRVEAGPGVDLDLTNGAKIVSYSPLNFRGSAEQKVRIHSSDATGQGLVVLKADGPSTLRHVIFDNLGTPRQGGWEVTGAVTFYESDVDLAEVQFLSARAEDSLNIVRSQFAMENVLFSVCESDAFDGDFVSGSIRHCAFEKSVNDAIDLSGSVVDIEDVQINQAGDKGISVGERSEATVRRTTIDESVVGIAAKDRSDVTLEDVRIVNSKIGLAAYQKKSEFGQAFITAIQLVLEGLGEQALFEPGSRIEIDGAPIGRTIEDLEAFLYPQEALPSSADAR